jgi:hypothetical protein
MGPATSEVGGAEAAAGSSHPRSVALFVGAGALISVGSIAVLGAMVALGWKGEPHRGKFAERFESRGYDLIQGQFIDVTVPVSRSAVYVAEVVRVKADVHANLAILARLTEIESTVNGDIDFLGHTLIVHKGGVVKGDVRARGGQLVEVNGAVGGQVLGAIGIRKPPAPSIRTVRNLTTGP